MMFPERGRNRVIIGGVTPEIDGGRYPIKRIVGQTVLVEADIFTDGHDVISGVLQYRHVDESRSSDRKPDEGDWQEVPLEFLVNDHWRAEFPVERVGRYEYGLLAWIDRFLSWHRDFQKRVAAGQDVSIDLRIGAELVHAAAEESPADVRDRLGTWVRRLKAKDAVTHAQQICEDAELPELMRTHSPRRFATRYDRRLFVTVDRLRAQFSSWYEFFPRSTASEHGRHGTFRDCERRLSYVASMGFDVVYLPPIHPIGQTFRKGRNNSVAAEAGEVGSPWAIGAAEGGHKAILPQLGTDEDFRRFVQAAKEHNIDVALDVAFQCSPDHPYVKSHPDWFRSRPDGTIQYAENPPKKYQDIYPFDFECADWKNLWAELQSIFLHWIEQGVRIFRVDNPHTKPLSFWEWCIGEIKREHPDVIFLAEAFTRPRIMERLAKMGFTQSYTYFAWRNNKAELTEYMTELTRTGLADYFRPNFWPNTPDILTEYLQIGGRPAFMIRLILAATLTANYGIYGPAFELLHATPREPGSEEYWDSEKYQIRHDELDQPNSLRDLIARVNAIRQEYRCLQANDSLTFHAIDNDQLLAYSKHTDDHAELLVCVVNLDPNYTQSGWLELSLEELGIDPVHPYQVHDLLSDSRYMWHGPRNFIELNPHISPAHLFRVRRHVRSEQNFDYFV